MRHYASCVMLDLTGHRFGRLTAIRQNGQRSSGEYLWLCHCTCGNRHTVRVSYLTTGHTKSCGCIVAKPDGNPKHGMSKTAAYSRWKYARWVAKKTDLPFLEWIAAVPKRDANFAKNSPKKSGA
jgi:hypothetical protein